MKVLLAVALICLAFGQEVDLSRRGIANYFDTYTYIADIGTDVDVTAFAVEEQEIVAVKSLDSALADQNFTRSKTLYSFNTTSPTFAVKLRNGKCLVGDTSLTYDAMIAELEIRNDTTVTISQTETWNATSGALDRDEKKDLFDEVPGLDRFCGASKVILVEAATPGASTDGTQEVTVLTYDAQATFLLPEKQNRGGGGMGNGMY